MSLLGAELLLYPTAIGSEPQDGTLDSAGHWRRAMVGHSAANLVPVVASNRVGTESFGPSHITFYGTGFITDNTGQVVAELGRAEEGVVCADVDLDANRRQRVSWGVFRDRRPELYGKLLTKDGETQMPFVK